MYSVDCRLSYRLWISVLSQRTSLIPLSLWLKRLSTLPLAAEGWDRFQTQSRGHFTALLLAVNHYCTPTHVFSTAAQVVFPLGVCAVILNSHMVIRYVVMSVKYVLMGHKCRVKGHLCLLLHRLLPLKSVNVCTVFFLIYDNVHVIKLCKICFNCK